MIAINGRVLVINFKIILNKIHRNNYLYQVPLEVIKFTPGGMRTLYNIPQQFHHLTI
jgi:hypothetical protein